MSIPSEISVVSIGQIPFQEPSSREALSDLVDRVGPEGLRLYYGRPAERPKVTLTPEQVRFKAANLYKETFQKSYPLVDRRYYVGLGIWDVLEVRADETVRRIRSCGGQWGCTPDDALKNTIASLALDAQRSKRLVVGYHEKFSEENAMFVLVRELNLVMPPRTPVFSAGTPSSRIKLTRE